MLRQTLLGTGVLLALAMAHLALPGATAHADEPSPSDPPGGLLGGLIGGVGETLDTVTTGINDTLTPPPPQEEQPAPDLTSAVGETLAQAGEVLAPVVEA